jgi:hypothetical protein
VVVGFNRLVGSPPVRLAVVITAVVAAIATAMSCSRLGDDRFPKLPDADLPDAPSFVVDAAGPADAEAFPDGDPDADPGAQPSDAEGVLAGSSFGR